MKVRNATLLDNSVITNLQRVVNRGREPGLTLLSAGGSEVTLSELADLP